MNRWLVPVSLALLLAITAPSMADTSAKTGNALLAAEAWLSVVDSGDYAKSWEEGSQFFRGYITQKAWVEVLEKVRKPQGALIVRQVTSTNFAMTLPGAPAGEYVVIVFQTSFDHAKDASETVSMKLDEGGAWRVAGYSFK